MRIVLVDPVSSTPPYDHALATALGGRGHDVHLLTSRFRFGATPAVVGFRRHERLFPLTDRLFARTPRSRVRFATRAVEYVPSSLALLRHVRALDPDVVHVQWLPRPMVDIHWLRALARGRPTLLTAHNLFPTRARELPSWHTVLATVDGVVVPSRRGATALESFGCDPRCLTVVFHPVFPPHPPTRPVARDESLLLMLGLVRAHKGLDVLVRALPAIVRAVPNARLLIAGDPMQSVSSLQQLASALGVADRIDWHLRYLVDHEIAASMGRSSVVVLPYRRGASSGVLATALGHRRPVVVSDVGSLGEIVRDYHAGRVIPPGDQDALATACVELLTDVSAWTDAAAGAGEAARVLTWDDAAEAHERAYALAIDARRTSPS